MPGRSDQYLLVPMGKQAITADLIGKLHGRNLQGRLEFEQGLRWLRLRELCFYQQQRPIFVGYQEINLLLFFVFDKMEDKSSPAQIIPHGHRPVQLQCHHIFKTGRGIFNAGCVPDVDFALLLNGAGNFSGLRGKAYD